MVNRLETPDTIYTINTMESNINSRPAWAFAIRNPPVTSREA
jgi:hypothetical protein